jgi:hypothetical protein
LLNNRQLALTRTAITHHQPPAVLIDVVDERADVLLDLRLKRRRDHPARAFPREIVQRHRRVSLIP